MGSFSPTPSTPATSSYGVKHGKKDAAVIKLRITETRAGGGCVWQQFKTLCWSFEIQLKEVDIFRVITDKNSVVLKTTWLKKTNRCICHWQLPVYVSSTKQNSHLLVLSLLYRLSFTFFLVCHIKYWCSLFTTRCISILNSNSSYQTFN